MYCEDVIEYHSIMNDNDNAKVSVYACEVKFPRLKIVVDDLLKSRFALAFNLHLPSRIRRDHAYKKARGDEVTHSADSTCSS